jgi:hypothetical protein
VSGKPAASDLKEGKVTLPLILYLADLDFEERRRVADDFANDRLSPEDLENLRRIIVSAGYADKTRAAAASHLAKAKRPSNPSRPRRKRAFWPRSWGPCSIGENKPRPPEAPLREPPRFAGTGRAVAGKAPGRKPPESTRNPPRGPLPCFFASKSDHGRASATSWAKRPPARSAANSDWPWPAWI